MLEAYGYGCVVHTRVNDSTGIRPYREAAAGMPCMQECVHLTHPGERGGSGVWGAERAVGRATSPGRRVGAGEGAPGRAAGGGAAGWVGAEAGGCGPPSEGMAGVRSPRARRRTQSSCGVGRQQEGSRRGQGLWRGVSGG